MSLGKIRLYHCEDARSFRPLWMLEELGAEYELIMLPFPPRARQRDYLEVNPLGTVPYFCDDGVRMSESAAICQYLADRASPGALAVGSAEAEFGSYLNWLHFGEATLTFPQTVSLRYGRLEPPERRQPQVADDYLAWFRGRLGAVERASETREYLCAGRFTAADVSVGYALMLAQRLGFGLERFAASARYWARLEQRAGYRAAIQRQARERVAQGVPSFAL